MAGKNGGTYSWIYRRSIEDPEGFWGEAARAVSWYRQWDRVPERAGREEGSPPPRLFHTGRFLEISNH